MIQENKILFNCDNISYLLDKSDFTAELVDISDTIENAYIPRSINYESHEYIIKIVRVSTTSDHIVKSIKFAIDSQVNLIDYLNSFQTLQNLEIPSSVTELGNFWCEDLYNLVSISISPQNKFFSYYDGKMIISKLDEQSEAYELLVFVRRDIDEVIIPSFIKKIGRFSFSNCQFISKIQFSQNSELTEICEFAFEASSIEEIEIPSEVVCIKDSAFADCTNLVKIEFGENSQLNTIEQFAFAQTPIEELKFPSKLRTLKKGWCLGTEYLCNIIISPENNFFKFINDKVICGKSNQEENVFDVIVFALRDIESVVIPSYIKKIKPYSFADCVNLEKVEFDEDPQLTSIGESSFFNSNLIDFVVPKSVVEIKKRAFDCSSIRACEVFGDDVVIGSRCFDNSELRLISFPNAQKVVIHDHNIARLFIPPKGIVVVQIIK